MKRNINAGWLFTMKADLLSESCMPTQLEQWEELDLPHTWNGRDGQDGGNDYHRGTCLYTKTLSRAELPEGEEVWLEFEAANASADVYVNGSRIAHHDGGYSLFRADMSACVQDVNTVVVAVDNSVNDKVYPQHADFTFYGGLYRNVNIIGVPKAHFALEPYGTPGLRITPEVCGKDASVTVEAYLTGLAGGEQLALTILDQGAPVTAAVIPAEAGRAELTITDVHLWHGRKDPHLYTCKAELLSGDKVLDTREMRFGCRTFRIDPQEGFFLNGESYPLRGVCRHQDRPDIGNALRPEHHIEDMDLICEVGANTIRLAHYQHDQFFYDLCDERGMVVWAEIPYISRHMATGRESTIEQMKDLVTQCYHHASIVVWGLSNEVTMEIPDPNDPDLIENHHILNDLVHGMDATRLTTEAVVISCPIDAAYVHIPDVVSYNLYLGWYQGNPAMNGPWLDRFHEQYPDMPLGLSEYGCEALDWHTSTPVCGDYTEEYQAYYHEELIKQLYTRPYLWATHVWNMFNFAADARSEGGCDGMNNKGLVSFDRKYRKDSFYAYKAWLSDEPFVHICGKRYEGRVEDTTRITVYSNQPSVELFANGRSLGVQQSDVHFFYFDVPNEGTTLLLAKAGECTDESKIVKLAEPNLDYVMHETGDVLNWFEIHAPQGFCSVADKVGQLLNSADARGLVLQTLKERLRREVSDAMLEDFRDMPLKRVLGLGWAKKCSREEMLELNERLNACRK